MADQITRSAAKLAALIALPLALLAGVGTFAVLNGAFTAAAESPPASPAPTGPATGPVPTEPVEMAAPELTDRQETVCRAVLSQLPSQLDELPQRPVTEGPEQNAAFGEPPITVACGVGPTDYQPGDFLSPHNGVCWHAAEQPDASVWTTLDREVPVQVTVPATYDGPFQRVLAVNDTVIETVRSTDTTTEGC